MTTVPLLPLDELLDGEPRRVVRGETALLLVRDGSLVHALEDRCSHASCRLSGGLVDGDCIICPCHGAEFDLRSGEALSLPAQEPVPTFPVTVVDGVVSVELADPAASQQEDP